MGEISVTLKQGGETRSFDPKSNSLRAVIEDINKNNMSIEEAEILAKVSPGAVLEALEKDDMLSAMDIYNFSNLFG